MTSYTRALCRSPSRVSHWRGLSSSCVVPNADVGVAAGDPCMLAVVDDVMLVLRHRRIVTLKLAANPGYIAGAQVYIDFMTWSATVTFRWQARDLRGKEAIVSNATQIWRRSDITMNGERYRTVQMFSCVRIRTAVAPAWIIILIFMFMSMWSELQAKIGSAIRQAWSARTVVMNKLNDVSLLGFI